MRLAKFNPNHDKRNGRFTRRSEPSAQKAPGYSSAGEDFSTLFLDHFTVVGGGNTKEDAWEIIRHLSAKLGSVLTLGDEKIHRSQGSEVIGGKKYFSLRTGEDVSSGVTHVDAGRGSPPNFRGVDIFLGKGDTMERAKAMAVHEFGHVIDCLLNSRNTYGSPLATRETPAPKDLFGVLKAIYESPAIDKFKDENRVAHEMFGVAQDLGKIIVETKSSVPTASYERKDDKELYQRVAMKVLQHNDYLLSPTECFARAFEQWLYLKTGDVDASRHQIGGEKTVGKYRFPQYPTWPDEEFKPIAEAMDSLFRSRRMLKQ